MGLSSAEVVKGTSGGDHGGVVGAVGTLREEDVDPAFLSVAREALSQVGVCGHSANHDQSLKVIATRRLERFLSEDGHDARQERCSDILFLLAWMLAEVVEDGGLQPGEAEVEPGGGGHRSRKRDRGGVFSLRRGSSA